LAGKKINSAAAVNGKLKPGRHSAGDNLYLRVKYETKGFDGKSWSYMWKRNGLQREIGLGPAKKLGLGDARELASIAGKAIALGADPKLALRPQDGKTFFNAAKACLASRNLDGINPKTEQKYSPKTKRKWERTVFEISAPLHRRAIQDISKRDILSILKPLWTSTPETARIVRSHLEIIMNYAKGLDWFVGENPAMWKGGLSFLLPELPRNKDSNHPAMNYNEVPSFIRDLKARKAMSARALHFTILTGARTSETLEAVWDEFDIEKALWAVPAPRMKGGRDHIVPLSDTALAIVKSMKETQHSEYVFPGYRPNRPLSNMAMLTLLKRMNRNDITVHGFRSSFRDWTGDCTMFPREVAEAAISHRVGDKSELAYRRGTALEKRKQLMQLWAEYCTGSYSGDVVQLHG
jgi:integrase